MWYEQPLDMITPPKYTHDCATKDARSVRNRDLFASLLLTMALIPNILKLLGIPPWGASGVWTLGGPSSGAKASLVPFAAKHN
jgi:hypothetical protein